MSTANERKKINAEQYLAENRIRWLMERLTSELIRFTPKDPLQFIADRTAEIRDQNVLHVDRPRIIAVLGGPGCGKGVACASLYQELGCTCIAPSEVLRNEVKEGTEIGQQVGDLLHNGALVPHDIIVPLIKRKITASADEETYVLDGFPRTIDQAVSLENDVCEVAMAVLLDVPEDVMRQRLKSRHEMSGHDDDVEPHVTEKIRSYKQNTLPVVEFYRALGKLVVINADRPEEEVVADVQKVVM